MHGSIGNRLATFSVIGVIALLAGCSAKVEPKRCGGPELVREVMLEQKRKFSYIAMQNNGVAEYTLFISTPVTTGSADGNTTVSTSWSLMEHLPADRHCIKAAGDRVEELVSQHDTNPKSRFGVPGSGYPRCSGGNSAIEMLDVRLWANRELGNSFVFAFSAEYGSSYVFLLNERKHWILLERDSQNPKITCYLARGQSTTSKTLVPR